MALKWFFSPKTGAKNSQATTNNNNNRVEAPVNDVKAKDSEHNTVTHHLEDSKSSLESHSNAEDVMPSSVLVTVNAVASASISVVSEMDEQSLSSDDEQEDEGDETESSSNDFMSYCQKVGSGRPSPAKGNTKSPTEASSSKSKRIPGIFSRSVSCRVEGDRKSPNHLSMSMRKKLSMGGPAAEALKVSLVAVPQEKPPTPLKRSKSLVCLTSSPSTTTQKDNENEQEEVENVGCDATTLPRKSNGNGTGVSSDTKTRDRDHCPELPHRKVSMSPEEVNKRTKKNKPTKSKTPKDKSRRSSSSSSSNRNDVSKEQRSGPTVPPEVMQSYVEQLQKRRKKKELVRNIRGRRAQEEDTKRKELSNQEMDEYLTIIKEVRMAKRQAKSRAMQEAIALQRADFLARLIHVSETENKAANPITPSPTSRI